MNRRLLTHMAAVVAVAVVAAVTVQAAPPTGYYRSLEGKKDKELKDAIQTLIAPHTVHSYNSLWYYFYETDARLDDPSQVWDMYSYTIYYWGVRGNSVDGMNKEHSLPKSWWGGTTNEAYTDLNHLVPSDARANTAKSNWPLGEVGSSVSFDNGLTLVGTPKAGQGGGASKVFEPGDEYKGDFARMYFYMATVYQDYNWVNTWQVSNADWHTLTPWSIDLLVRWAREDPVSEKEIARNDAVFRCQNNRNPFIDDGLLFEYIWGNRTGQVYDINHSGEVNPDPDPDGDPILITPTQGTLLDFGDVDFGQTTTRTLYVKGLYLTSNLNVQLYRYDYQMFGVSATSIDYTQVCTDQGYPLQVSYTPTATGDHRAKILITGGGIVGSIGIDIKARCIEPVYVVRGDLNGDYDVDIDDVNLMVNYLMGVVSDDDLFELANPDLSGDGIVDIDDLNQLVNILLNK